MKFRKKPVVIEAFMVGYDVEPEWIKNRKDVEKGYDSHSDVYMISTLEGIMRAGFGDYIIKGVKGEIYPCKPDIFEMTYELAADSETNEEGKT